MIREIVHYDAPVLRAKGKEVDPSSPAIQSLIDDLFDTMRHARGVGLAAQQIGEAVQVAVIDISGVKERPSKMWIKGEPVNPEDYMPMILINPVLKPTKTKVTSHEGCLSFPGLTLDIPRAQRVGSRRAPSTAACLSSMRVDYWDGPFCMRSIIFTGGSISTTSARKRNAPSRKTSNISSAGNLFRCVKKKKNKFFLVHTCVF